MTAPLIIIGRCVEIGYKDDQDNRTRKMPFSAKKLLAWMGPKKSGDLVIVDDQGETDDAVPSDGAYKNFHGEKADRMRAVDWTPATASASILGLCVYVRYRIPAPMRSNKEGSDWVHFFGDFGGGDHRKGDEYKPLLVMQRGHFYISRRASNKYYLDQWLEG